MNIFYFKGAYEKILARLAGIEPTTPWFVAKYSIQLSYSRPVLQNKIISDFKNMT